MCDKNGRNLVRTTIIIKFEIPRHPVYWNTPRYNFVKSDCHIHMYLHARALCFPFSRNAAVLLYIISAYTSILYIHTWNVPSVIIFCHFYHFIFFFFIGLCSLYTSVSSNSYYLCLNRQIRNMNCILLCR